MENLKHEYIRVNGIRLHYVTAGQGPLLLMLHGFPEFWYSWRHQIPLLSPYFTVVAPDLRGYNLSDKPNWGYETDVLVRDVAELITALGHNDAVVLGHDWGGMLAWLLAIDHPARVRQLVAMNIPHPALFLQAVRSNPRQLLRSWYIAFFQLPGLPEMLIRANDFAAVERMLRGTAANKAAFSDEDIARYKEALRQPGALSAAIAYYRHLLSPTNTARSFGLVAAPTLLIWGEQDVALGKELTYGTERLVPNLQTRYIAEAGHWVQQEAPAAVNEALLAFLVTGASDT